MKTNYLMLKELLQVYHPKNKMIFSDGEPELIANALHLEEMDILALRNLRDFVVAVLDDSDWDRMSAITYCIDEIIYKRGGEV